MPKIVSLYFIMKFMGYYYVISFNKTSLKTYFTACGFKLISMDNLEDVIRKSDDKIRNNITTAIFEKL